MTKIKIKVKRRKENNNTALINPEEIKNLIYLLGDSDEEVAQHVEAKIFSFGSDVIPFLEVASLQSSNFENLDILYRLIANLRRNEIFIDLKNWKNQVYPDLLEGMNILERIEFPNTRLADLEKDINKIKLDAWLELNYDLTSFEQVKILNYIFFDVHNFKGNTTKYHAVENSFLSQVLETKKGNPVSMAIIYILVAQRLNIPIYGINLPQHFVLGYKKTQGLSIISHINDSSNLNHQIKGEIMFYLNPFSNGSILNHDSLKSFLKQLKIEPKKDYFDVCSNVEILKRVLRNLIYSYKKVNNNTKASVCAKLLDIL